MEKNNSIKIKGARTHNLKNIDVDIPREKIVVITGVSGSGKSSLAFDTLYAEGQRKYVESLSGYARQFIEIMGKPDADSIEGISPAVAISSKRSAHNSRSTVGTMTEIHDYLRLLFSKAGKPYCPKCDKLLSKQSLEQFAKKIQKNIGNQALILGPVEIKSNFESAVKELKRKGFVRARIDGKVVKLENAAIGEKIEAVIDQIPISNEFNKKRFFDSVKIALRIGNGIVVVNSRKFKDGEVEFETDFSNDLTFNENYTCEFCGFSLPILEPKLFSFNSPVGACSLCTGLGEKAEIDPELLIPNKNLTIDEGAIRPFVRSMARAGEDSSLWSSLKSLGERNGFLLSEPIGNLSPKDMKVLLYGDKKFLGVIPILEKKYRDSLSDWTHQELEQYMIVKTCQECLGKRLRKEALAVKFADYDISQLSEMSLKNLNAFFSKIKTNEVSRLIIKEITNRLKLLANIGLDYLTLSRKAGTLSGGEEQRIKLAMQIGAKLHGVLYVLDEPSVGLHAKDQEKLMKIINELKRLGNTVVVVEHDSNTIKSADWVIDIGPGAGRDGGKVVFVGTPAKLLKSKTLTGEYLSGKRKIGGQKSKSQNLNVKFLEVKGAEENNLKNINAKIPLGKFVCITGVSGSGKSSLVNDILAKALLKKFYNAKDNPGKHKSIEGIDNLSKVVLVDQSAIGRTPRSNPATYTGIFSFIRDIFSLTKEAKARGYSSGKFSFNVKGGRCEACEGQGQIKVEMYFLPDVYVECQECKGKRYSKEALEIEHKGKNISEVLDMTVKEALEFFKDSPGLWQKLKVLDKVGLSYIKLGQPAPSLSGGEAQRVKLATELSRKESGHTLYILDEPTTGLHFDDISKLINVLQELSDKGNTVLAVEHNLDFINCSDWIIDLGPEGGEKGGYIIAEGTPQEIKKNKTSWTGKYLSKI